jgi:phosphoribosylamine--glycine ligase
MKRRVAVLVSGGGTNLQALIDAGGGGMPHVEIALVVSSSKNALALRRAEEAGIASIVLEKQYTGGLFHNMRYDTALCALLTEQHIEVVVLAGFLVILGEKVLAAYQNRIINIHPSLLPSFGGKGYYGLIVHREALLRGVKVSGATVHIVDGTVDGGKIIEQKAVSVHSDDSPETLQRRIMEEAEWVLLPRALEALCKNMLNVAVIGSGGREHAIIKRLCKSARFAKLCALPGNAGMKGDAELVPIPAHDVVGVVSFCTARKIDFVVVSPDAPLALGMVDALEAAGVPAFGPNKAAAQIEASKIFSKNLMKRHGIPTAAYEVFDDVEEALRSVRNFFSRGGEGEEGFTGSGKDCRVPGGGSKKNDSSGKDCGVPGGGSKKNDSSGKDCGGKGGGGKKSKKVIKADGLALGKGVMICSGLREAEDALIMMMREKKFGQSGTRVVIEDFLEGPEVSVLAFCDGNTLVPLVSSMDHKRALNGDAGLNTGGMGAIAPNPFYTAEVARECMRTIYIPTVEAMRDEGAPFKGCLYFGLMLTSRGPKVIEYNCRFGDPETQVVLPLLEGDLLEIMLACTNGTLEAVRVKTSEGGAAACVIMASGGYPEKYQQGFEIQGIAEAETWEEGITVYCAGVAEKEGSLVTAGGRVLGVTAKADTLKDAIACAYRAVGRIHFERAHYRKDIGGTAL